MKEEIQIKGNGYENLKVNLGSHDMSSSSDTVCRSVIKVFIIWISLRKCSGTKFIQFSLFSLSEVLVISLNLKKTCGFWAFF